MPPVAAPANADQSEEAGRLKEKIFAQDQMSETSTYEAAGHVDGDVGPGPVDGSGGSGRAH